MLWWLLAAALYSGFVLLRRNVFGIEDVDESIGTRDGWLGLPGQTLAVVALFAVLNVAAFYAVLADPLITERVGGATVVLAAIGLTVPVGIWLVYWGSDADPCSRT